MPEDQARRGSTHVQVHRVRVNGAELYCEVHGSGPPVLFIPPSSGDGGLFEWVADELENEFSVILYDRRGNSRSAAPPEWKATSVEEQANDAAGLLEALEVGAAAIWGNSASGAIAVELMVHHRELVRGVILHDPVLLWLLKTPELRRALAATPVPVEEALRTRGPRAAMELRVRGMLTDQVWEGLAPPLQERMLGNGRTVYFVEVDAWFRYQADEAALSAVDVPVYLLRSEADPPAFAEIRSRLAALLPVARVLTIPGTRTHVPHLERHVETAAALRACLRETFAA